MNNPKYKARSGFKVRTTKDIMRETGIVYEKVILIRKLLFETIKAHLKLGYQIHLEDFGDFMVVKRKPKKSFHIRTRKIPLPGHWRKTFEPGTHVPVVLPERFQVKFKPSRTMRRAVWISNFNRPVDIPHHFWQCNNHARR